MCVLFAKAELNPNLERFHSHRGKLGAKFWFWIHIAAALVMLAAAGYIGYTQHYNVNDDHSIFWGEVAVILAFGISWLAKGIDTKALWPGKLQSGNQDVVHGKTSASLNPNAQTPRHHGSH
jgi:anaerobic C4-dicarboxylate transporter